MNRIANKNADDYVRRRVPFKGSNLYATEVVLPHSVVFAVFSYGEHFPLYVAETDGDLNTEWYENIERYSQSTTRHKAQCRVHWPCIPMSIPALQRIAREGIAGLATKGE